MGQSSSKDSVTLTSHKKAEESTPNGKENQHETTDQPGEVQKTQDSKSENADHTNNSDSASEQNVTFTIEKNQERKIEMENGVGSPTAEKADLLKKRTSFYETVDASEILPHLIIGKFARVSIVFFLFNPTSK